LVIIWILTGFEKAFKALNFTIQLATQSLPAKGKENILSSFFFLF